MKTNVRDIIQINEYIRERENDRFALSLFFLSVFEKQKKSSNQKIRDHQAKNNAYTVYINEKKERTIRWFYFS